MSPIRYFLIPFGALAAIAFLFALSYGSEYAWIAVIPLILIAAVLSLRHQVEWWYWNNIGAPDIPTRYAPIVDKFNLYQRLDIEGKREFRRRAFLLKEAMQFIAKGPDKVPEDVQYMVAASAATVSFHKKDFSFPELDTVVFYPHLFPSPKYDTLHSSELYVPDGTFIFTLNFFADSVIEPQQYLQLGIYEFVKAYKVTYPSNRLPSISWEQIAAISRFEQNKLEEFIGLEDLDMSAIGACLYFTHTDKFRSLYPDLFNAYNCIFNLL